MVSKQLFVEVKASDWKVGRKAVLLNAKNSTQGDSNFATVLAVLNVLVVSTIFASSHNGNSRSTMGCGYPHACDTSHINHWCSGSIATKLGGELSMMVPH
jgi:hypothetical protein